MSPDDSPAENAYLRATVAELRATVADLRGTIAALQAHLDRLVRRTFDRRTSRSSGRPGSTASARMSQPLMSQPSRPVMSQPVSHPMTWCPPGRTRRDHGRKPLPAGPPRELVEIDLPDADNPCPCCRTLRVRVGVDVSERLDYTPASAFVRETARVRYACRRCEQRGDPPQFAAPALPPEPIPKGVAGAGLLAHVIVSKCCDHLPLYRQQTVLARLGWDVSRSTLGDHLRRCADLLGPVYRAMCGRVRRSVVLFADDTPVTLLDPRRTAYARVYVGDDANPYTVFDLTPGRRQEFPAAFLKGYTGFVHAW